MKSRIKAKSFDLMQYFYKEAHDPMIHGLLRFTGHINESVLKKAVVQSAQAVPVLFCRFQTGSGRPRWEKQNFAEDDIVKVIAAAEDDGRLVETLLASVIHIETGPQVKLLIARNPQHDTLCVVMNHMVCDGAGFKQYLYLLSDIYAGLLQNRPVKIVQGSRGTAQLFSNFGFLQRMKILCSKYDLSPQKNQPGYPLQGNPRNPFFVTYKIDSGKLEKIKTSGKINGATINDMVLTAYARVLSQKTGNSRIVIPCPVDLRKYLPAHTGTFCNLTSNYICQVEIDRNSTFQETLRVVSGQMREQKNRDSCLKSVILLETAFHLIPFQLLQKNFAKLFTIPVLSYTNLGVIDRDRLQFLGVDLVDAFVTGAVKYTPYFQIAVSTFDGNMTLSCNFHGTQQDREKIEDFLSGMAQTLITLQ